MALGPRAFAGAEHWEPAFRFARTLAGGSQLPTLVRIREPAATIAILRSLATEACEERGSAPRTD